MSSVNASAQVELGDSAPAFVDRRAGSASPAGLERRQFSNSHAELSPPAREMALAIDRYKLEHRRKFITYEEIYSVLTALGYEKRGEPS